MKKWRFIVIILVIALILLFLPAKFSQNLRNFSWQIIKPIGLVGNVTFGKSISYLKSAFHLNRIIKQNSNLISENLQLQSELAKLSEMENENEVLKKELGFMQTQDLTTTVAAAVIGRSNDYLKSLVIDKGQKNNIAIGDAVISQGVLIGTVSQVRANNSDVALITDYDSLIPVVLQSSRGTGLLRGGLGGLTVEDIPLNTQIKNNEKIVTSGLGEQIPAGILIGHVTGIISKESEIFQKISVYSPIDFSNLKVVFVLKK